MKRKIPLYALLAILLLSISSAEAQQPGKALRIGLLITGSASSFSKNIEAFRKGLRELDYVEGKNIAIEYRYAEGRLERLPDLAAELVRLKVEAIVTPGLGASVAKNTTKTIPIVVTNAGDPVGQGLVASLAQPGGNVTGLSSFSSDLGGKRLELLKETFPKTSRVAVLWSPANKSNALELEDAKIAAGRLQVTVQSLELRGPDDFEPAFLPIKSERGALLSCYGAPLLRLIEHGSWT